MRYLTVLVALVFVLTACQSTGTKDKSADEVAAQQEKVEDKQESPKPEIRSPNQVGSIDGSDDNANMQAAMQLYNAGIGHYKKGEKQEALEKFKESLAIYPENSKTNHYLGRLYYDFGQKTLAMSYYEDAVRYNVEDSASILGIGQIYFDQGDYENALKYYNMTIDLAPGYSLAYYNRGTLMGMQNKYQPALEDLNIAIELNPDNGNYYVNRGLAHYYLRLLDKACEDWQKAADMGMPAGKKAVETYCR